jgi:hypothetical protein
MPHKSVIADHWDQGRRENVGSAYNENIHQLIEFCCELLTLVQNACISEASEGGSVLAYARISDCASKIQGIAEKRRETIALGESKHAMSWEMRGSKRIEVRRGFP